MNVEVLAAHDGPRWGLIRAKTIPQEATLANIANLSEVQWIEEAAPRKLFNDFAVMGQHLKRIWSINRLWMRAGGLGGLPADLYELYDEAFTNEARIHSDSWGSAVYGQYTVDSQSSDESM